MKKITALLASLCLCFSLWFPAPALAAESQSIPSYTVTPNTIYGKGEIIEAGSAMLRDLWMDVYEPLETPPEMPEPRPAVIFTHGGAFHRGDPRHTYHEGGAQDTSPGDYCRKLASRGYVCFAIAYRLATENPRPSRLGYEDSDLNEESVTILFDQVNKIRSGMVDEEGNPLDPLDPENLEDIAFLHRAVLSAAEDLRLAFRHICRHSGEYHIDPERVVLGGFSAGAITSLNVAHGMHEPVAGVFLLSGANVGFDILNTVTDSSDTPPILMFQGQNDLEAAFVAIPDLLQHYEDVGVSYKFAWVPAFGHFYPAGATSLSGDGSKISVEERIVQFLKKTVGKPEVDPYWVR